MPLIEESATLDLKQMYGWLWEYFESFSRITLCASVNGSRRQMPKIYEDKRFVKANKIMVPTVIGSGSNVPNASVMSLRNAERFGLSQLHQLRGEVRERRWAKLLRADASNELSKIRESGSIRWANQWRLWDANVDLRLREQEILMGKPNQSGHYRFIDCCLE